MNEHWTDRLSDYLGGDLTAVERVALEAHLATCEGCSRTLDELRDVIVQARALEDRPPEQDLWPAIAARLAPRRGSLATRLGAWLRRPPRRLTLGVPQLAAAGVLLVLLSAGTVWVASRIVHAPAPPAAPGVSEEPSSPGPGGSSFATFDPTRYDAAVAELERVLRENRADLDPETVRVLEENLEIIDRATEQARRALMADPGNPYLNGHLAEQMKRKIRVLQRATGVVAAQS